MGMKCKLMECQLERKKDSSSLSHIRTAKTAYHTKNMALKSPSTTEKQLNSNTRPLTKTPKALIAGFALEAIWLASAAILVLLIAAVTVTPGQSNTLNSHQLLQHMAKPFLIRRDSKLTPNNTTGEKATVFSDNMKAPAVSSISPSTTSTSTLSSALSRSTQKRPLIGFAQNLAKPLKIFKPTSPPSSNPASSQSLVETLNNLESASGLDSTRVAAPSTNRSDLNNNSPSLAPHDINNNTIQTGPSSNHQNRNINSVNGTIDLSLYANSDVDRLYGDALLVYVKNFNETLPTRKETISLNGTLVPTYRSSSRVARVPRWQ